MASAIASKKATGGAVTVNAVYMHSVAVCGGGVCVCGGGCLGRGSWADNTSRQTRQYDAASSAQPNYLG